MNPGSERIAVPTNGRGPRPDPAPARPAESGPPDLPPATAPFTPIQLAVGFGILASIVAILYGRLRRRGRPRRRGPFDRG